MMTVALLGVALSGCGTDTSTSEAPPRVKQHLIGHAQVAGVEAHVAPSADSKVVASFQRFNDQGAPQVFLLEPTQRAADGSLPDGTRWVKALLPVRPNGTTGYIRLRDLKVVATDYHLEVDRKSFSLTLFEGGRDVMSVPVGIGTGETPTPVGRFYLASLLQPPDPNTIYGPYAYGLSGYSETLLDWADGGIIGLHGTNDPGSIGRASSHGCIRLKNQHIKKLVPLLPLGTPIEIH